MSAVLKWLKEEDEQRKESLLNSFGLTKEVRKYYTDLTGGTEFGIMIPDIKYKGYAKGFREWAIKKGIAKEENFD